MTPEYCSICGKARLLATVNGTRVCGQCAEKIRNENR